MNGLHSSYWIRCNCVAMENYTKGETKEVDEPPVFDLGEDGIQMRVSGGSKIRNLMGYAMTKIKEPGIKKICWNGSGNAVTKTVSCAEIMKRKVKGLEQITKIRYRRVEEYWEPKIEGLERLKVNKDIPAITILLSKEPLDKSEPGFQPAGPFEEFWKEVVEKDKSRPRKRHDKQRALDSLEKVMPTHAEGRKQKGGGRRKGGGKNSNTANGAS